VSEHAGPRPTLTFLGAAGTVTGSRFLIEWAGTRVLVDAGLYQGVAGFRRRNWESLPFDPATLDAVVVSHAHLDHTGYLPRLVKDGFRGRIVSTFETAELAAVVLRDSAHLQEEDARYANEAGFSKHSPALPLYDAGDVERTLPLFTPTGYHEPTDLGSDRIVTLQSAGHILGSASVLLDVAGHTVAFSGDLGRPHHPLLLPPDPPPAATTMVVESTYGDRTHPAPDDSVLADAISRTVKRGGSVLIPAFAVDRTELVLLALRRLAKSGRIPRVPIFVDSPMALATLEIYRSAATRPGSGMRGTADDVFGSTDLTAVHSADESIRLNRPSYPCIVISASGMATGGRVVHHLRYQLPDPRNTVILTGYQAEGTRGRQLLEGVRQVKMHGRYVPVKAEIVMAEDFSVHADSDEMLAWLARAPRPPRTVYVVHGEPRSSRRLSDRIAEELDWCAVVPTYGERVLLD
jgi:metallo-beta-lactamase family protein